MRALYVECSVLFTSLISRIWSLTPASLYPKPSKAATSVLSGTENWKIPSRKKLDTEITSKAFLFSGIVVPHSSPAYTGCSPGTSTGCFTDTA